MRDEQTMRMEIGGMTCTQCEVHVRNALQEAGACEVTADWQRGEARFTVPAGTDAGTLAEAVRGAGYQPGNLQATNVEAPGAAADSARATASPNGTYDLAVIGSGGAAFAAAIDARAQGARVAMIERGVMGGTCVNIGCVPSKTLLRAGDIYHQARNHPFAGLSTAGSGVDMSLLIGQKNELVRELRQTKYVDLVAEYGIDLILSEAQFIDGEHLRVGEQTVTAGAFLIATGASPAVPDIPGLREVSYLASTSALDLKAVPASLAVIGSGFIALELGQLYRHLGAQVTLMQRGSKLLKDYDPEIGESMAGVLEAQGITWLGGVRYQRVEEDRVGKRIFIEAGGEPAVIEAEQLLIAAGRQPNTAALALDRAGVEQGSRGEVLVDPFMRTSNPRIYAAGDVTLGPQFVYVAAYQGAMAARNALGSEKRPVDLSTVPGVIFTNPSIATVGLTEQQARAAGHVVQASVLPLKHVPRALVNRETRGVFKLIADEGTGRVLGAHVVAENAGDVIYAATLAVKFGLTVQNLRETLAPYLTMAEGLKLSALAMETDVSKLSCCAG